MLHKLISINIFLNKTLKTRIANLKRQTIFFAFFLLFVFVFGNILQTKAAVVKPTSNFYVNDYANVLTSDTKNYIMNTNIQLEQKTGAQIVVVTIQSLDGMTIEEYAHELFNNFEIGDKSKNNGLLLLCSVGDRKFRVEVGDGLEGKLPDGKTGRMQDEYIIPYLRENNFDEGIKNGFSAFLAEVADEYGVTISNIQNAVSQEDEDIDDSVVIILSIIIFAAIYGSILFLRFRGGPPFIFFGGGRK